jgi:RND family efflux transporter MFP subunit
MTKRSSVSWAAVLAVLAALAAAGCGVGKATGVRTRPALAVELLELRPARFSEAIEVVGALAAKREAELKSEFTGTIAAVHVTEWVPVRRGQPLASLDPRESEAVLEAARAAVLQAEVAASRARREQERAAQLKEFGLMTQQGLDEAGTTVLAAAAALKAARAQLGAAETRSAKQVIAAPFDGVVSFRGVNVGDRVESMGSGAPIFRVVDNRLLELSMNVASSQLASIRVGQQVEFAVDALPGRSFRGRVMFVNPTVDAANRSAKVVAHVQNAGGELRGGLFAKARILTAERDGVLQVPRTAIQGWDVAARTGAVFVVRNGVAERRAVRTGAVAGDAVEISGGLAAGERVVTRGAFTLRHGDRVRPVAAQGA